MWLAGAIRGVEQGEQYSRVAADAASLSSSTCWGTHREHTRSAWAMHTGRSASLHMRSCSACSAAAASGDARRRCATASRHQLTSVRMLSAAWARHNLGHAACQTAACKQVRCAVGLVQGSPSGWWGCLGVIESISYSNTLSDRCTRLRYECRRFMTSSEAATAGCGD